MEPAWETPPPNVLLLSIDTLRADHLGHYGYPRDTSPSLDRLAAESVVFENAQASSSWTLPGLATAITSQYSSTTNVWSYTSRLAPSFTTLAELLRDYGYDTASASSHQFLSPSFGLQQGMVHLEDLLGAGETGSAYTSTSPAISDAGVRFLEAKAAAPDGVPWLLWLHYFDPHNEYLPHPGITEEFEDPEHPDRHVSLYDGEIRFTDDHVARVLDALAQAAFPNGTLILFFSDHGEEFGDHGGTNHGHTLYDELTRIPFVIQAPGFAPRRVPELVRTVDLMPTVLELVSHPIPDGLAGRSLVPLLRGEPRGAPGYAVSEVRLHADASLESIQDERWKLVRARHEGGADLLFDVLRDPGQHDDVAALHPEVVRELARALRGIVRRAELAADVFERSTELDLSPALLEDLRQLGYVGEDG